MENFANKIGNSKNEEEFLGHLSDWTKSSQSYGMIDQNLGQINEYLRKIENLASYLAQDEVDVDEIMNTCAFLKAHILSIQQNVHDSEEKNNTVEKLKLSAAKKLIQEGKFEEGYKALFKISDQNKNTEIGKTALLEAHKVLTNRKTEIERRINAKKENSKQAG